MTASRRGILGGLAVLAAPAMPALAAGLPAFNPDAKLIRLCAAYIEAVEAYNDGGGYLEPEDDPLWAAIEEVEAEVDGLEATTLAGIAAKARVAVFLAETPHGEDFSTSHTGDWPEQVVRDVLRLAAI